MRIRQHGKNLVIDPPHNQAILAFSRELPGRRRWKDGALWIEGSGENIRFLVERFPQVKTLDQLPAVQEQLTVDEQAPARQQLPPEAAAFMFKTPPYQHQLEAFGLARNAKEFGFLMEQGCVDAETEYLSPTGWKRISEYAGGQVAEYEPSTGQAQFVEPQGYVVKPCSEMAWFKSKYGCDQMFSMDHRMLVVAPYKPVRKTREWGEYLVPYDSRRWIVETTPAKYLERFGSHKLNKMLTIPHFRMEGKELDISDVRLRLMVAFIADGSFGEKGMWSSPSGTRKGTIRIKKERKVRRLRDLLHEAEIDYVEKESGEFSLFSFIPPLNCKHFYQDFWWGISYRQKQIIAEECLHWDGSQGKAFFSSVREDAEYIQFCFSSTGKRARLSENNGEYTVTIAQQELTTLRYEGQSVPIDGKMYCFKVPSSYLVFRRNGCVFVSGNTGKSKVLIDNAASLYADGEIERVVVLAPNGVHYQWVDEQLPLHMPDHLNWDGIAYNPKAGRREMTEWDRRALGGAEGLQWMTMAYQSLSMSEKAKKKFLAAITGRTMLILDESHNIKNHSAKRTQFILKHREYAEYRRIATGTPITQGLEDLYTQFRFLNPRIIGHNTFTSFRSQYCRTMPIPGAPAGAVRIIGYQNVDELRSRIKGYSYEVLKEDCLDLPDKVYQQRYVELTPEQAKHYKTLKEDLLAQIDNGTIVEAPLALTQLVKLQQVLCGHVIDAEGATHPVPSNRVQAVKDILAEKKRAIIWARFRYDIRTLHAELTKEGYNCGMYYGDTSEAERERLRKPGEVDVLIANPQSAGTGLNLTHFDTAIYYSNSFDAALRWQSEDRIHRIGQKNHCTYVDLVVPKTLDAKIVDALRKKKAVASTIQEVKTALS